MIIPPEYTYSSSCCLPLTCKTAQKKHCRLACLIPKVLIMFSLIVIHTQDSVLSYFQSGQLASIGVKTFYCVITEPQSPALNVSWFANLCCSRWVFPDDYIFQINIVFFLKGAYFKFRSCFCKNNYNLQLVTNCWNFTSTTQVVRHSDEMLWIFHVKVTIHSTCFA